MPATNETMRRTMTKSDFDKWDVGDRYELKRMLGRGSYGEVAQAIDLHAMASRPGGGSKDQTIVPHHSAYVADSRNQPLMHVP